MGTLSAGKGTTAGTIERSLLETMLAVSEPDGQHSPVLVGRCLEGTDQHHAGRVLVAFPNRQGQMESQWLTVLRGVGICPGDDLLLVQPGNWPLPVVLGAIGTGEAAAIQPTVTSTVEVGKHESIELKTADGATLLAVSAGPSGPVVQLANDDLTLAVRGRLELRAASIDLRAESGAMELRAADDVIVQGDKIRLN